MRAYLVAPLLFVFSPIFASSANASSIVDLQFSGEGHTITFSLPDSAIVMDHPHAVTFGASAPAVIDGVSGYTVQGLYYVPGFFTVPSIVLTVPSTINAGQLVFWGTNGVSSTVIPIANPTLQHPDDLLVTFVPGTYNLGLSSSGFFNDPIGTYTLTISAETTPVPEPDSLVLWATGALGLVAVAGSRMRRAYACATAC